MSPTRMLAIAAGVLYLVTHVTSVPAPFLYDPILNRADYVLGSGSDTRVLVGAFLEVICALGIVGTAVALFPVVKRQHEAIALGYVGLRTLEAGIIIVDVIPLLVVVRLREQVAGWHQALDDHAWHSGERVPHHTGPGPATSGATRQAHRCCTLALGASPVSLREPSRDATQNGGVATA